MTISDILNKAIELIQAGEKTEAQRLLEPYLEANPRDITAWLWIARSKSSLEGRIKVLEMCLTHNPDQQQVQVVLAALNTQKNRNNYLTGTILDQQAPSFVQ